MTQCAGGKPQLVETKETTSKYCELGQRQRLFGKQRSTCKFGIGSSFHILRTNEGGKSGMRSKGTYRMYCAERGESRIKGH